MLRGLPGGIKLILRLSTKRIAFLFTRQGRRHGARRTIPAAENDRSCYDAQSHHEFLNGGLWL